VRMFRIMFDLFMALVDIVTFRRFGEWKGDSILTAFEVDTLCCERFARYSISNV
jgi:hypothetical protein